MAIQKRWQRRGEARPGELLEHALACFSERGVDATTLDEIAARAGVTKRTIYHYFAGKDDLLAHLISDLAMPAVATLATAAAGESAVADRLEAVMRRHWQLLSTTQLGRIPRLMVSEIGRHPELINRLLEAVGRHVFGLYGELVAVGVASGVFQRIDPRQAAQLIALPMVARVIISGPPQVDALLGPAGDFIDTHCAATRRWLAVTPEATCA